MMLTNGTRIQSLDPQYRYIQGTHSNCIFKFPVFSLSEGKFSLCQFTRFVTITYTKLPYQALKEIEDFCGKFRNNIFYL